MKIIKFYEIEKIIKIIKIIKMMKEIERLESKNRIILIITIIFGIAPYIGILVWQSSNILYYIIALVWSNLCFLYGHHTYFYTHKTLNMYQRNKMTKDILNRLQSEPIIYLIYGLIVIIVPLFFIGISLPHFLFGVIWSGCWSAVVCSDYFKLEEDNNVFILRVEEQQTDQLNQVEVENDNDHIILVDQPVEIVSDK